MGLRFAMPAQAAEDVMRATLDNGLRVIVVRNTLAPVVSTSVNYLVGSDETPPGFPGTAHALEHMMFRGSPGISADQLALIGSAMGGNFNADTQESVTQYLFTVPAEDLDLVLHIEADRMRALSISQAEWAHERGAIEQEVAQDFSNPFYVLYSKLRASLFAGTPYAHDPLGTRPSFQKTTAAALKRFRDQWYVPNNALLVIAGNVDPTMAIGKVREHFAKIPARNLPARPQWHLRPVRAQSLSLPTDLPFALQVIAFRMPGSSSPDFAAAQVLADALKNPRGALYGLVLRGKALQTAFEFNPLRNAGFGYSVAEFSPDQDGKAIESEVRAILTRIVRDGVPPDLVAAAKLEERRSLEFQKNSISNTAMLWSQAVAVEGLESPEQDIARIEQVTPEDVNRVARRYLDLGHAVSAILTPQGSGKPLSSASFGGQEKVSLGEAKPTALPTWAAGALEHLVVPPSAVHPVVSTLSNGMTLIVQPEDVSDTVGVYGYVRNRPELQVPKGEEGMSQVLDRLFPYGTESMDRVAFEQALDAIGAEAHPGSQFSVETLSEHFDRAVQLLAAIELHPRLPQDAFEIVKRQVAQSVAGDRKSPGYQAERAMRTALLPENDPGLREALPETVERLTLQQVRDYYRSAFRPDLAVIVVIGKVTPEAAKSVIEKYFGAWSASGPRPETDLPPVPENSSATVAVPDAARVQDRVTLAQNVGLTRSHPDYYALELGNSVLGGGFYSTRLTRDIRKEAGLVYSIRSNLDVGKTRGLYAVRYASDPEHVARVRDMVRLELERMQKEPVPDGELTQAKAILLRRIPLQEESAEAIARGLIRRWELDLPLDEPTRAAARFLTTGAAEVRAAFAKWIRPKALVLVSQGPAPK